MHRISMSNNIRRRQPRQAIMSYGVAIIIGTSFKELEALASKMHVWAPDVPEYAGNGRMSIANNQAYSDTQGVTYYYYEAAEAPEETFLSLIDTVALHHG